MKFDVFWVQITSNLSLKEGKEGYRGVLTMNYEIREESESKKERKTPKKRAIEGFSEFWDLYPKKVAKNVAMLRWCTVNPDTELRAEIMKALEIHKKTDQWQKDGGAYIPHAGTWLHQRRWEDEIKVEKPINNKYAKYA